MTFITKTLPIQRLKEKIPFPKVPPSVEKLYSQKALEKTFPNPNQRQAFLTIQTMSLYLVDPKGVYCGYPFYTPEKEILLPDIEDPPDIVRMEERFPGLERFSLELEIFHAVHRHTNSAITLRERFESANEEEPGYYSDTAKMLLERIEDDVRFLLEDPFNNYSKYVATKRSRKENHSIQPTRMDLTRKMILDSISKLLESNQGQAIRITDWIGHIYAQSKDDLLYYSLNEMFPSAFMCRE